MSYNICGDNRFELIEKYKKKLIESTNIEDSPEEMKVLNDIFFRLWQMGWLDRLEKKGEEIDGLREMLAKKGEWIYSDLLRVKHGTMSIDALIDKVYADMRGDKE